jgi:hypothetical protein
MQQQISQQRDVLRSRDVRQVALHSGANWDEAGALSLTFLQQPLTVSLPGYEVSIEDGHEAPILIQGIVIAYLLAATGEHRAGEWIAFRELPDGAFYHRAFTGYTGGLLARTLGDDLAAFERGAKGTGGYKLSGLGDAAYEFRVLPRLWMAAVYWLGDPDDGFPAQASILFDRVASRYLITDGLAIIGSQLVRRILSEAGG